MENSIEEAVKTMERWVEYEKNNKDKINKADELINIQETILSDYKRVLKKNEKYKQFFDLMLRLDAGYFFHCEDEETNKLVDDILKLESEE